MDIIIIFFLTIVLISVIGLLFRPPPFLTLTWGALFFGLLNGGALDEVILQITIGIGKTFSTFAILIVSGAVIAKILVGQGSVKEIVSDIRRFSKSNRVISAVSAYLLTVPLACCITAFILLTPIIQHLEADTKKHNTLLYLAGLASILSFALVFPNPMIVPTLNLVPGFSPVFYEILAIPLSLVILFILILGRKSAEQNNNTIESNPEALHFKAWAPFIAICIAIPVGLYGFHLSHQSLISFIMMIGMITVLAFASSGKRVSGFTDGAKHAGVILFDICGAGALGYVFVQSGLAHEAFSSIEGLVPTIFVPFLFAVLIQTAQGSRLVTTVITAEILAGMSVVTSLHPFALIMAIGGGACILSYITDPYFWIIQKATNDDTLTVIKKYTIPLACIGLVLFAIGGIVQMITR